jgi:hypothetical protein
VGVKSIAVGNQVARIGFDSLAKAPSWQRRELEFDDAEWLVIAEMMDGRATFAIDLTVVRKNLSLVSD